MLVYHYNGTHNAFVPDFGAGSGGELNEIIRALTDRENELREACRRVRKSIEEMPAGDERDAYEAAHARIIESFEQSAKICAALVEKFES